MRLLVRPLPLLLLITALFTFLIQSGELGTSDTTHRLQVAHSLWTPEPQVFPNEYPEFGIHGRGGRLFAWYGIGQSLLMLPADLIGSAAGHLPFWSDYASNGADPSIRSIIVSFSTNILINVLTALASFRLLSLFCFTTRESIAGALGLLVATTHLHYAQNMTENNYILLLTITGMTLQYQWLTTGSRRALFWGATALGLNLLTRITTTLDILGVVCFLLLAFFFASRVNRLNPLHTASLATENRSARSELRTYVATAVPIYAIFFFLDRIYQYIRFGSWTNTYFSVLARESRQRDPSLPLSFPFNGSWFHGGFSSGVFGPLFAPEKSIFLFDPMLLLMLLLAPLLWKRLTPPMRAFLVATLLLLTAYIAFYASFLWWPGDFAWGDRYVSSAAELATLLAIPLLFRYWKTLAQTIRSLALAIIAASVAIQCASLAFWLPLEIYQMETFGHPTWVVLLRFKNIAAFALGRREAWGLNTPAMFDDPWDAAHITAWNFLPSLLRHIGAAPLWVVYILYGVWLAVAFALLFASARFIRAVFRPAHLDGTQNEYRRISRNQSDSHGSNL
ncbi:MAG: hypothetical protein ABSA39_16085 [Edaphobacter sp.]